METGSDEDHDYRLENVQLDIIILEERVREERFRIIIGCFFDVCLKTMIRLIESLFWN